MSDFPKSYIIRLSALQFGLNENFKENVEGYEDLEKFIESENAMVLYVANRDSCLKFCRNVPNDPHKKIIIFYKCKPCILVQENIYDSIQTSSVPSTSPALALYQTLNNVFSPLMQKKSNESSNVQVQINNLQNNLRSLIFAEKPQENKHPNEISFAVIESLEHEVEYWKSQSTLKDRLARKMSNYFTENLEPLAKEYSVIDVLPIFEVDDLLEKTHNVFDDIWKYNPPFPSERMPHLMDIIGSDLSKYTAKQLKQYNIWEVDFSKLCEILQQHIQIGEKWLSTCKQLTEIFWPNYAAHPWTEKVYQPNDLVNFVLLLKDILNYRTIHRQLTRLLTKEEQEELNTKEMFKPFQDTDIFLCVDDVGKHLFKCQKQFEYLLQPAERRVALKLKRQLSSVNSNIRQLLYEFSRYSELVCRPVLKQILQSERQFLLTSLHDYLNEIQKQSTSESISISAKREIPQNIKEIMAIRQLESRAKEVLKLSEKILNDLTGFENLHQNVVELIEDLKRQHHELFEVWCAEITSYIKDNTLSLKESDPVVQFSKTKLMIVTYNPRLVSLISEVRQLRAMEYNVPNHISETVEHAKRFMKYARLLEQIANFHNTIGDRMVPSQKPMMLNSALELSKLVQEEKVVSWGEVRAVEKYVDTLNKAVEKLSKENSLLTSFHVQAIDKIRELEVADLLKDFNKWKEATKFTRNTVNQVESKGFKNMQNWKNDIDKQLSAVLEKQYIKSFDKLHLNFQEIPVDLIYRNSTLEFNPNETNLKNMYEQQLRKYLEIPRSFRGVSEDPGQIFSSILDRNQEALKNVEKHKREIFEQLSSVMKHWQSWLQLENLDTTKLSTWQHWDLHFRASKTFGQEIAKLPSAEEKVGCFVIGLSRLRSDLESHNRSYWDKLVYTLKDSIAEDVVKLQNYIDPSTAALTRQPVSLEELGESGVTHAGILREVPEMEGTFEGMMKKSQILANWSREQVDSVNRARAAWERLQNLLENRQHIIAKQMETVKTTLNIENENLIKDFERFDAKWQQTRPRSSPASVAGDSLEYLANVWTDVKQKRNEYQDLMERHEKLAQDFAKFNFEVPKLELAETIENNLNEEEKTWQIFEEFYDAFEKIQNEYWIVFRKRIHTFEDFLLSWESKLKTAANTNELASKILAEITKYKDIVPTLKTVRGEDFSEKHWSDVFSLLKIEAKPVDQILLKDFLNASENLQNSTKELQVMSKKAASEIVVRQALAELDHWDVHAKFALTVHKDSQNREVFVIKEFRDVLNKIGDNQSLLQSLKSSADYESFSERISNWDTKLNDLDNNLSALAQIQRKWVYLEPIFGGGTLPQEKSRFERIDRDFRRILSSVEENQRVSSILRHQNLRNVLENLQDQLGRCQNSLNNFLKQKRDKFPRFLFLSDDDLLEVVGQSSKEQVIQTHLKKIFSGIHRIRLDKDEESITAMVSSHGEVVPLSQSVCIKKPIEEWLGNLVTEMQGTLKQLLVKCQMEKQAPDPTLYPSQILCLTESIAFTARCESAISNVSLPPLLAKYKTQLAHYNSLEFQVEQDDHQVLELKLKALILDTIHHITILEELLKSNVAQISDWVWQKQLRFYANSVGEVTVKMATARMEYSYEYLGNAAKLVRTPLTERCFLTLTQSLHLGMGGNPYGPAGTGKTESVKALGGLLGRQVLVFNCDEGVDAASMARILGGLVRTGAWGCFDEFNRLDQATLSAVSMTVQPIQEALRADARSLALNGEEIAMNKHCGVFITLNPAGSAYGGRNKLPDNLKQLFRPVVMTHPDDEQISRCLLHCDGFKNADALAKKIVEVFRHAGKVLSKQQHYDWGLRAIRTILASCGKALKKFKISNEDCTTNDEFGLVVDVIKTDTLSKLTYSDSVKFVEILGDVFKDAHAETVENKQFEDTIKTCFEDLQLATNERQVEKCVELLKQLDQRMGVAIVGPPSSGKTTIRNLAFKALNKMNQSVRQYEFNPKSITRRQLLGSNSDTTGQWCDGVLTVYSLQVTAEPQNVRSWIVCDGDVDPDWVESLNSVLDDNRLLSLPSGWRIQFGNNVNFIFETHNLEHASPATISRMGIVFLSEQDLEVESFVKKRLESFPEENRPILEPLMDEYFFKALDWVVKEADTTLPRSKIAVAETALSLLKNARNKAHFANALVNSLGQQLQQDFREVFAQQIYEWMEQSVPSQILKCGYNKDRDLVENYYTNPNVSIEDVTQGLTLVETGQVKLYLEMLESWLNGYEKNNFLIVGRHGSAKSLIVSRLIEKLNDVDVITIFCSSNLQPNYIIDKLFQHCIAVNTHKGKTLKPKKGNLMLYVRNLHLPKHDKWGTSTLVEFLRQILVHRGFFDKNIEFVRVENVFVVGSLRSTTHVSPRFVSNLRIFNVNPPEQEDMSIIFSAYLQAIIKQHFPNQNFPRAKTIKITTALISIYEKIKNIFPVGTVKQYYAFSPHDLTTWCSNVRNYECPEEEITNFELFLVEILTYEIVKTVGDTLANIEDKTKLYAIINETFSSQLNIANILNSVLNMYCISISGKKLVAMSKCNKENWTSTVQAAIKNYEREGHSLGVIINDEILELSCGILKSVSTPYGHVVLIGKSGLGRRSSVKIVSSIGSAKLVTVSCDKQPYFNNCLKQALQWAALEDFEVYLQLEDHMFESDTNLNLVNLLISSGEVPNLYAAAELDSMTTCLKEECDSENFDKGLIRYFCEKIKRNLHVIVCLDAENRNLSDIMINCPALSYKSTIICGNDWSEKSVEDVPKKIIEKCANAGFSKIYRGTRLSIATPSRLVSMVRVYTKFYNTKLGYIDDKTCKLQAGVNKLNDAKDHVSKLKRDALAQREKLAEKQAKANAALDMISGTMRNASSRKEEMESLKTKTERENAQLVQRKAEIEAELSEVEPLIAEARQAVGNIRPEALSEIRSLRAPPDVIRDILEGVLRLMGIQDTSWNSMKTFLSKRGVKEEIRSFDASRIQSENRRAVERLLSAKSESFEARSAKRASVAAAPLAAWVAANVRYSRVLDNIKPLEKEQGKLKRNLDEAEAQLGELSAGLLDVDDTVAKLKEQLSAYTKEAAAIEIDLAKVEATLATAEGLVEKLSDEYTRWQEQLSTLSGEKEHLSTGCLLASAFVTFLSEQSENARKEFMDKWQNSIGVTPDFNFEAFLSTEREQMQWQIEGLSNDKLSIQNSIIMNESDLVPLIIDPTSKIIDWLKIHWKHKQLESVTQNSVKFNTVLELSIRFGKVLIVDEVEGISPSLLPILRREYIQQGERRLIRIDEKVIDCHQDFFLVLATRNEHFRLPPNVCPLITVLNFIVSHEGLSEQLLLSAVKQEKPELEEKRNKLLREKEELQEKQFSLQSRLLEDLGNSTGDILENKQLLESLNETKASSVAIDQALVESVEVQSILTGEYDAFREISNFASRLYFAFNAFSQSNVFYVISIKSFTKLFLIALQAFQNLENNLEAQKKHLFSVVYSHMSKGIFEEDRLMFLLRVCHNLFPNDIPENEWNVFLGNVLRNNETGDSVPSWIPNNSRGPVHTIQNCLPDLYNALRLDEYTLWKQFLTSNSCENSFPSHCGRASHFQKILTIQALRRDRLLSSITQGVSRMAGLKTVDPAILDLARVFKETEKGEPVLILSTAGTDPSPEVRTLAERRGKKYVEIAMGESQRKTAVEHLRRCCESGEWLILKNLHLVTYWLPELSEHLRRNVRINEDFRLWLLSEPSDNFSFVITQNSLKIVYETPRGLKNNILRTFSAFEEKKFEKFTTTAARIFFAASCVHALVEERLRYIPQGWSKYYEFSIVDFSTFTKLLEDIWQSQGSRIPWIYISKLCSSVYGGRIENNDDLTILESYSREYFLDQVLSHKWRPFGSDVSLPSSASRKEYMNSLNALPNKDKPIFFGLPENIDGAWEKQTSEKIIGQLKSFASAKFSNLDRETYHGGLSTFLHLWKKLNNEKDFIRTTIPEFSKKSSPIANFIEEEYRDALILIQTIHKSFANLNKISKGFMRAETSDLDTLRSLLKFETPKLWNSFWRGPSEADRYLKTVIDKISSLEKYQNNSNLQTTDVNLSNLLRPEGFIASLKQEYSRFAKVSMEKLYLQTSWTSTGNEGIILKDLLIEGAIFENFTLKPCAENSENLNVAPHCYLSFSDKVNLRDEDDHLSIPLYKYKSREEKISTLTVRCEIKDKDKWIQSGLAFYLE